MRGLITGGAGFVGSHLCDRFIKEGYTVIAMDNLITGDLRNIEHLFKLADFGSCSTDTLDYERSNKKEIADKMEQFERYTTLMYRPPEMIDQYLKFPVNFQSDIWMIGCILFTLCFAKHPFFEAQKLAIVNAHYFIPDEDNERVGTKLRDLI